MTHNRRTVVGGLGALAAGLALPRTEANTWLSTEAGKKGRIKEGQLADLAVQRVGARVPRASGRSRNR
jgi:hypothetical protein